MSLERWMNEQRRATPIRFWLGWMLPFSLFIIFCGLVGIAWAITIGWLQ